jgi:hypothetical protein
MAKFELKLPKMGERSQKQPLQIVKRGWWQNWSGWSALATDKVDSEVPRSFRYFDRALFGKMI